MWYRNTAVAAALICAAIIGVAWLRHMPTPVALVVPTAERDSVYIGGVHVQVDIVDTPSAQEKGLSGRSELSTNEGMLFIFPEDGIYQFWMKDMLLSIDMIWISQSGKVVYIEKNATPESYPTVFGPDTPTRYVLEVPAGFSDMHGVSVGDNVGL